MAGIKDVASLAGVSVTTASIVLRGKSDAMKISLATQNRVASAARQLGYIPNISARRLRQPEGGPLTIAVFEEWSSPGLSMSEFLSGVFTASRKNNVQNEISIIPFKRKELQQIISYSYLSRFHAAIFSNISADDLKFLEKEVLPIPVVIYNRKSDIYCTVNADNAAVGRSAAEIFASRGHKKAGIITSYRAGSEADLKVDNFLSTAKKLGMNAKIIFSERSMAAGYITAKELVSKAELPDCLFCLSDFAGAGVLHSLSEERIRSPEDIEVIAVSNYTEEIEAAYSTTPLSVIMIPVKQMGEICVEKLLYMLENRGTIPASAELPVAYISLNSCGKLITK